jgi:hypothetical protein
MGGSCSAFDYACGDPLNSSDLTGTCVIGVFGKNCHERRLWVGRYLRAAPAVLTVAAILGSGGTALLVGSAVLSTINAGLECTDI